MPENNDYSALAVEANLLADNQSNKAEAQALKEQAEIFDHKRNQDLKNTFHIWFVRGLRVVAMTAIIVCLIRVYHLVAPANWCWMDEKQIQSLDKILFSGSVGGIFGRYLSQAFPSNGAA